MAVWYEIRKYSNEIGEEEIPKESPIFIYHANGRREAKLGQYSRWFKSRDEAVSVLRARLQNTIKRCISEKEEAEAALRLL